MAMIEEFGHGEDYIVPIQYLWAFLKWLIYGSFSEACLYCAGLPIFLSFMFKAAVY